MYRCVLFRAQARGPRQASKGDINGTWQHDLFDGNKSLSARLSSSGAPPKMNMSLAERALREANGETGIAIKGASSRGNVVEISGLADGTTSADVEVRNCRLPSPCYSFLNKVGPAGYLQALWSYHEPFRGQRKDRGRAPRVQERKGRAGSGLEVQRPASRWAHSARQGRRRAERLAQWAFEHPSR